MDLPTTSVHRLCEERGVTVTLERPGTRAQFISARRVQSDNLSPFDGIPPATGTVVAQMVFGDCHFRDALIHRTAGMNWPQLWLESDESPGGSVDGAFAFAIEGRPVRRLDLAGRIAGSAWSDADADYCLLAGVLPADRTAGREAQTQSCLEQIEAALRKAGMDFLHVVRTWFYLDDLLCWYDDFNKARTAFFHARGVFDHLVPASTGIGARNPERAALAAGALAIRPRHSGVTISPVASPLQCPALSYRSSFSRAVEIAFPDRRLLTISGTASIAPDGKSLHRGDAAKQIELSLDVVEAILHSRSMTWQDTIRAVGYFRDLAVWPAFQACCRRRNLPHMPLIPAHATVCRDELLFEIELDAIAR